MITRCDRCGHPIYGKPDRTKIGAAVHESRNVCDQVELAVRYACTEERDRIHQAAREFWLAVGMKP